MEGEYQGRQLVSELCADMVMQGQTSRSNETLPNAASSITILPPPHPPTNTTAKVGSAWLASIYTLVFEQSACHPVVFFSRWALMRQLQSRLAWL